MNRNTNIRTRCLGALAWLVSTCLLSCDAGSHIPGNFAITAAVKNERNISLAWTESVGASSYTVKYGVISGQYETTLSTNATSPYTAFGLTGVYYFMVEAVNANGTTRAQAEKKGIQQLAVDASVATTDVLQAANLTCHLSSAGDIKCWGSGAGGQLGQGHTNNLGDSPGELGGNLPAIDLGNGRTAVNVAVDSRPCAVLDDGRVKCWGSLVGDDPGEMGDNLPFTDFGTDRTVVALSGECALLDNGTVKCLGQSVLDLGSGRSAVQICMPSPSCALLDNGTVKCWGTNSFGELGRGNTVTVGTTASEMGDNLTAIDLGTGRTAIQIACGTKQVCALLDNGTVKCWGFNTWGQLGQGHTARLGDGPGEMGDNLTAIDLGAGKTALQISTGAREACAILNDYSVKCWGFNSYGQLGQEHFRTLGDQPNEMGDNLLPINLGTGRRALQIKSSFHTCAILDDGNVKCWGKNAHGELGQGHADRFGGQANEMGDNLPVVELGH